MTQHAYPVKPCPVCGADVVNAVSLAGARLVLDAEPSADGWVQLRPGHDGTPVAEVLNVTARFGKTQLREPHRCTRTISKEQ